MEVASLYNKSLVSKKTWHVIGTVLIWNHLSSNLFFILHNFLIVLSIYCYFHQIQRRFRSLLNGFHGEAPPFYRLEVYIKRFLSQLMIFETVRLLWGMSKRFYGVCQGWVTHSINLTAILNLRIIFKFIYVEHKLFWLLQLKWVLTKKIQCVVWTVL